jgi:hypothetical protein
MVEEVGLASPQVVASPLVVASPSPLVVAFPWVVEVEFLDQDWDTCQKGRVVVASLVEVVPDTQCRVVASCILEVALEERPEVVDMASEVYFQVDSIPVVELLEGMVVQSQAQILVVKRTQTLL